MDDISKTRLYFFFSTTWMETLHWHHDTHRTIHYRHLIWLKIRVLFWQVNSIKNSSFILTSKFYQKFKFYFDKRILLKAWSQCNLHFMFVHSKDLEQKLDKHPFCFLDKTSGSALVCKWYPLRWFDKKKSKTGTQTFMSPGTKTCDEQYSMFCNLLIFLIQLWTNIVERSVRKI